MSGTWRAARIARVCGRCGTAIAADTPGFEVRVPGVSRALLRCPACADATMHAAPPAVSAPLPFARFTPAALSLDWKARASGAREPGMEG